MKIFSNFFTASSKGSSFASSLTKRKISETPLFFTLYQIVKEIRSGFWKGFKNQLMHLIIHFTLIQKFFPDFFDQQTLYLLCDIWAVPF